HDDYEHTVTHYINRLRIKIEKDAAEPEIVRTVWGKGYKFAEPTPDASL
ncbi:winged helix-turn-helix domain-containing protein, partial [Enterobacter kobei]|nr:winged helix-turn-helix domain-containing protein [Enterobacter kobei]